MSLAPDPGVGRRAAETVDAQQVMSITVRGETHTIALNIIPISERLVVRKATGLPLEAFVGEVEIGGAGKIGLDTVMVLWWLARRANGERNLSWGAAVHQWPADLEPDDLDIEITDPAAEAVDPEV